MQNRQVVYGLQYHNSEFVHFKSYQVVELTYDPNPRSLFKTRKMAEKKTTSGHLYHHCGRIVPAANLAVVEVELHWK